MKKESTREKRSFIFDVASEPTDESSSQRVQRGSFGVTMKHNKILERTPRNCLNMGVSHAPKPKTDGSWSKHGFRPSWATGMSGKRPASASDPVRSLISNCATPRDRSNSATPTINTTISVHSAVVTKMEYEQFALKASFMRSTRSNRYSEFAKMGML